MIGAAILFAASSQQPFSSLGLRQGMTRAEAEEVIGVKVANGVTEVDGMADDHGFTALFCKDRLHALRVAQANAVEWLSAVEWLHSQGFRLGLAQFSAREDGKVERRELRQSLSHPRAPYRVMARMISRSSPAGAEVRYQLDFTSNSRCLER